MKIIEQTGIRTRLLYRGHNLYAVITPQSLDLSMIQTEADANTLVGLDIIAKLATLALEHGVSAEDISGAIWEASRATTDLAGQLSAAISDHIK